MKNICGVCLVVVSEELLCQDATPFRAFRTRAPFPVLLCSMFMHWLALLFIACALAACAAGPRVVDHAFRFDARWDSPDAEVLDFRYGDSKLPGVRPPEWALKEGSIGQATGVNGPMLIGDSLYVKWRIKSTGEVYQDTVNLRSRLPADIKDHTIYFIIKGAQLYVYLISPDKLNPNPCPPHDVLLRLSKSDNPDDRILFMYCYRKISKIYPDQLKR